MTNTVPGCCGYARPPKCRDGRNNAMRARIWIEALAFALLAAVCATVGPAIAQAPAQPTNAGPVQPWGLPPLPPGVGPIEKFADVSNTPQGKFLEGGAFDDQGNLWFVGIGSGWISYLQPDGKLVPVVNCNPPAEIGQTCEPERGAGMRKSLARARRRERSAYRALRWSSGGSRRAPPSAPSSPQTGTEGSQ